MGINIIRNIVGEFRKICHPRNVEFNEVRKICFSGAKHWWFSRVANLRSPEVANMRGSGILNLRSLGVANMRRSGILNLRSLGVANMLRSGISNLRSHELRETGNSRICRKSDLEVTARGDLANKGIHELLRSKVKVVVSKSPGSECELVADL
jgi:hypothetical protein